jgi:hypothetical protein
MICEANHGWFAEMQHNGIRIFSTANLGSEPSRGSHNGATILHPNTKVLEFQGLFVFFWGMKTNILQHCTFS